MKREPFELVLNDFRGLELDRDVTRRPANSWSELTGWDLYVDGSIRRVAGLEELVPGFVTPGIIAITSYRRTPQSQAMVVGIDTQGGVWDLINGIQLSPSYFPTGIFHTPVAIMPGFGFNSEAGSGRQRVNWLYFLDDNGQVVKWNPDDVSPIPAGAVVPTQLNGCAVRLAQYTTSVDPSKGVPILVSRAYRITLFAPTMNLESSPSDDRLIETTSSRTALFATDFIVPQAVVGQQLYLTSAVFRVQINLSLTNTGYFHLKFYISRDGNETYFASTNYIVWRQHDDVWLTPDEDGSVELDLSGPGVQNLWFYDGVANPADNGFTTILTSAAPDPTTYGEASFLPVQDSALVDPGPEPSENDPPPSRGVTWLAPYQGRLYLAVGNQVYFSEVDEPDSYPPDNKLVVSNRDYASIKSLIPFYQQLMIAKKNGTSRLTGTGFEDFVLTPLEPQVGVVGPRSWATVNGALWFWSTMGLMRWVSDIPEPVGQLIRPFTSLIQGDVYYDEINAATDTQRELIVFSFYNRIEGEEGQYSQLILVDLSRPSPFSIYPLAESDSIVTALTEVEMPDGTMQILLARGLRVFKLFSGVLDQESIATTQVLPIDPIQRRRIWNYLYVDGTDLEGVTYEVSFDGGPFRAPRPVLAQNYLGVTSRTIQLRFRYQGEEIPILTSLRLEGVDIGYGRGY